MGESVNRHKNMMNRNNENGVTIIAAIFIIVILGFMGVMFLTMVNSGSFTAVNDIQSAQASYVAEGGVEFNQRSLALNLDWYRSADPLSTTTLNLGPTGSFTVTTTVPATVLRNRIPTAGSLAPISVYSSNRFPIPGDLQIEDDISADAEFIHYTNIVGNTFTGLTRNVTIGTVTGASGAGAHARGSRVYPVTTLIDAMPNDCNAIASLRITAHLKFLGAGTLDIEGEEILYAGSSTAGAVMTLAGAQRCRGVIGPMAHPAGRPVTPVLVGGDSANYEAEVVSTGTVGSAGRMVRKTIQR
jgi:hypothetical protein